MNSLQTRPISLPATVRRVLPALFVLTLPMGVPAAQAPIAPTAAEAWSAVLIRGAEAAGSKVTRPREIVARNREEAIRLK